MIGGFAKAGVEGEVSLRRGLNSMRLTTLSPFGVSIDVSGAEELNGNARAIFELAHQHSLAIVKGAGVLAEDAFTSFVEELAGYEIVDFQGTKVINIKVDETSPNYIFSREKVPVHWDGAFHVLPRFLVWNCVEGSPGGGGETFFVNGEMVPEFRSSEEVAQMRDTKVTYSIEKLAHFGGEVTSPLMDKHPYKDLDVLRYAEPVRTQRNPLHVRVLGEHDQETVEREMEELIYEPSITYTHAWETGDIVIADNYSLLHGRNPLTDSSARHIRRIHAR